MTVRLTQLSAPSSLSASSTNVSGGSLSAGTTYYIRVAAQTACSGSYYYYIFQRPSNWSYELTSPVSSYISVTVNSGDNAIDISWGSVSAPTFLDGTTRTIGYLLFITDKDPATYGQSAWATAYVRNPSKGCGYATTQSTSYTFKSTSEICSTKIHNSQRNYALPYDLDASYLGEQPLLEIDNESANITSSTLASYLGSFAHEDKANFVTVANIRYTNSSGYYINLQHKHIHFYRSQIWSDNTGSILMNYSHISYVGYYRRLYPAGHKINKGSVIAAEYYYYPAENYLVNSSASFNEQSGLDLADTPVTGMFAMRGYSTLENLIIDSPRQWYYSYPMKIKNSKINGYLYFDMSLPPASYGHNAETDFIYQDLVFDATAGRHFYAFARASAAGCSKDDCYTQGITTSLIPLVDCLFYNGGVITTIDGVENVPSMYVYTGYYSESKYWHIALYYNIEVFVKDEKGNPISNADIIFIPSQDSRWTALNPNSEPNTTGTTDSNGYAKIKLRWGITTKYDYASDSIVSQYVIRFFPFTVKITKNGYDIYTLKNYVPKFKDKLHLTLKYDKIKVI